MRRILTALAAAALSVRPAPAQAPFTPGELARDVASRFAAGAAERFDSVYPFERGAGMVRFAASRGLARRATVAHVVRAEGDTAVILLGGHVEFGNSGNETGYATGYSGLYAARRTPVGWRLVSRILPSATGRIRSQALGVALEPGRGLAVDDTMDVEVRGANGFAVHLNHRAAVAAVRVNGRAVRHQAGGGILWVPAREGPTRIIIRYTLDVARDSAADPNAGRFAAPFGHVRGEYFWHPRFDTESGAGTAFRIMVRAPAAYHVAADVPQNARVAGGVRVVRAASAGPTSSLSLFYDREWCVTERRVGGFRFVSFATPGFTPSADSLAVEFERAYRLLAGIFGTPRGGYIAVVQGRAREGAGWLFRSNDALVAAERGGVFLVGHPAPRAYFGHEVAHGWTNPTGEAARFLSEGWATFAESLLLRAGYGVEVERTFWERSRNLYEIGGYEGRSRIRGDQGDLSYHKGAWIFRMLRDAVGDSAFTRGMRAYMSIPIGQPAGVEELAAALSRASGRDIASFLRPWVEEAVIPDVDAHAEGERIVITQRGPVFQLPLELEIHTASGAPVRRTIWLARAADTVVVPGAELLDVHVDPEHRLLLRRRRGEVVRFEHTAPGAERVMLRGNLSSAEIPAVRDGEQWSVTLPLTEGRYAYSWVVDGNATPLRLRVVLPREELENPYPR